MSILIQNQKVALVHDWLTGVGGAEKVLKALHEIFPSAPIYTLFHNEKFSTEFLPEAEIKSTFLQKYYNFFRGHKFLIPFLPLAVESINLSEYDLVISSAPFAKGLILKPKTTHINYSLGPTRQFWDWQVEYRQENRRTPKSYVSFFQHIMRIWDRHASTRVDYFVTYSKNTQERIEKYYHDVADVIYPPVINQSSQLNLFDSSAIIYQPLAVSYFLIVSRLYRHKNIHLAVRSFNKLKWPLVIIGEGPEMRYLKSIAEKNIIFLGYQPDDVVQNYYINSSAFIMPQEEDFGMTPIEAMSYGKPVLALKRGGALEYIQEGINGEFFEDPCEEMLADGVRRLKENLPYYDSEKIKKTVEHFSRQRFTDEISLLIAKLSSPMGHEIPISQFETNH